MKNINHIKLKIKIKHLALEPAIIRKEEQSLLRQSAWIRKQYGTNDLDENDNELEALRFAYYDLSQHRKINVREEARATLLVYGYLRGKKYSEVEHPLSNYWNINTTSVCRMIMTYGPIYYTKYTDKSHPENLKNMKDVLKEFRTWIDTCKKPALEAKQLKEQQKRKVDVSV